MNDEKKIRAYRVTVTYDVVAETAEEATDQVFNLLCDQSEGWPHDDVVISGEDEGAGRILAPSVENAAWAGHLVPAEDGEEWTWVPDTTGAEGEA